MENKFRPMMTAEQKKAMLKKDKMKESCCLVLVDDNSYYYPETIRFFTHQLPEIKKWKVGKEYELTIKVKMVSYEERKTVDGKEKEEGRFEVTAVKSNGKALLNDKQNKILEFMSDEDYD